MQCQGQDRKLEVDHGEPEHWWRAGRGGSPSALGNSRKAAENSSSESRPHMKRAGETCGNNPESVVDSFCGMVD